jgi:hypothetical protein
MNSNRTIATMAAKVLKFVSEGTTPFVFSRHIRILKSRSSKRLINN